MTVQKILLVRNDKLGDFILALPAFALIKQAAPHWHLTALVPEYTAPLTRLCPFLDDVLIDAGRHAPAAARRATRTAVRAGGFDAAVAFFSNSYNAALLWRAGIRERYAPATKAAQFLFNRRLRQRRSRSEQPEYVYNLDLARYLLAQHGLNAASVAAPYLSFPPQQVAERRRQLAHELRLEAQRPLVFIHSGSGGSANNLQPEQYARLTAKLLHDTEAAVVLTAGPGESEAAHALLQQCGGAQARLAVYESRHGLPDFALSCAACAAFIAGSTGTLHLAAALNRPTVGFYPSAPTASPLRWQTVNDAHRRLAFAPPADRPEQQHDLSLININTAWVQIRPFLQREAFQAA